MNDESFKRVLSSIILFPVVISIIIYSSILLNLLLIICFCLVVYEWHMLSKTKKYYFLGIFFLILSFYTIYKFKDLNNNYINFLFILLICISTDIGGYIFGKIFKGPKLTRISPKKTYSGAVGSFFLTCLVVSIIFFIFTNNFNFLILFLSIMVSLGCQVGDLFFSFLKRTAKIKDSGNFLPGHGGVLDRIDGMLIGIPLGLITIILIY